MDVSGRFLVVKPWCFLGAFFGVMILLFFGMVFLVYRCFVSLYLDPAK